MNYRLSEFGEAAKNIRKEMKLSQKQVRSFVGINEDTLRRTEKGLTMPTIETLDLLSLVYKRDMNDVFSHYKITYDRYFEERIKKITPSLRTFDQEAMLTEVQSFLKEFENSKHIDQRLVLEKSTQYLEYLKGVINVKNAFKDKSRDDLTNLIKVIPAPQEHELVILDKLEIRIYILIAIIYRNKDEFDLSKLYLETALHSVKMRYKHDKDFLYFYFLVVINYLTYYHRIDDFKALDDLYKESLQVMEEHLGIQVFSTVLIRAGINKHRLSEGDAKELLLVGLCLLKDAGFEEQSERYLQSFSVRYPEIFN